MNTIHSIVFAFSVPLLQQITPYVEKKLVAVHFKWKIRNAAELLQKLSNEIVSLCNFDRKWYNFYVTFEIFSKLKVI